LRVFGSNFQFFPITFVSSREFSSFGNKPGLCGVTAYRSPIDLAVQNLGWLIWQVIPSGDPSLFEVAAAVVVVVFSVGVLVDIGEAALLIAAEFRVVL
jgi:hypothetical protein